MLRCAATTTEQFMFLVHGYLSTWQDMCILYSTDLMKLCRKLILDALLTCARSTAPSAVGMSTTPSLRVASLASRPSTGLGTSLAASRLAKAEIRQGLEKKWEREKNPVQLIKVSEILHQDLSSRFSATGGLGGGGGGWPGLGFPHLFIACVCFPCCKRIPDV